MIIVVFHILKKLGEIVNMVSRDMEYVKRTTIKFLELKAFMSYVKNMYKRINGISNLAEENISEPEA